MPEYEIPASIKTRKIRGLDEWFDNFLWSLDAQDSEATFYSMRKNWKLINEQEKGSETLRFYSINESIYVERVSTEGEVARFSLVAEITQR